MPIDRLMMLNRKRPNVAGMALLICAAASSLALGGCAAPMGRGWADYKSRREIEKVAADDSFPSAAEVGLASTNVETNH